MIYAIRYTLYAKRKNAFTLVETLASVGILVTFLTAALVSFTATQNLSEGTQQQAGVLQEAKAKLEEIRASNFRNLLTAYGDGGTGTGQAFTIAAGEIMGNIVLTDVYDDDPTVQQLWLGAHDDYPMGTGDNWTQAGDFLGVAMAGRRQHASVVFDDKIWVLGGYEWTNKNDIWSSSDNGQTWNNVTNSAWTVGGTEFPRQAHTSAVFKDQIWVMGGAGPLPLNDVWSSSDGVTWDRLTNNAWSPISSSGIYNHASVVFDDKIWVLGGLAGVVINSIWYSEDGITWTKVDTSASPQMWSPRKAHSAVVFDNKIWVMGGNISGSTYFNDVWYSSDGKIWTLATNNAWTSGGRYEHSSVVLDGRIWVLGGRKTGGNALNEVWFSFDGVNWEEAVTPIWSGNGRCEQSSVSYSNKLWILGGEDTGSSPSDDVRWSYGPQRMYQADITVSWRQRNGRIVGEDNGGTNGPTSAEALNGILDTGVGEDTNGNGVLDSPVHITGLLANRGYPSQIYLGRE